LERVADGGQPEAEAGKDDRHSAGKTVGRTYGQEHAPRRLVEHPGFEQRVHGVPLRRVLDGTDEKAPLEFSSGERRRAVDAAPVVAELGELGVAAEHGARALAPG